LTVSLPCRQAHLRRSRDRRNPAWPVNQTSSLFGFGAVHPPVFRFSHYPAGACDGFIHAFLLSFLLGKQPTRHLPAGDRGRDRQSEWPELSGVAVWVCRGGPFYSSSPVPNAYLGLAKAGVL